MSALQGHCKQCGEPLQTTPGRDAFCEYCGFPLPAPLRGPSENLTALHQLLKECVPREDWYGAVQILERMIAATHDAYVEARYHHALGSIHTEKRRDWRAGVQSFERALRLQPHYLAAFNSLARTLLEQRRWGELERVYQEVIEAVSRPDARHDRPVLSILWKGLAALYREHLDNPEAARLCQKRSEHLAD